MTESDRLFGYVAFETGDEMSRRKKFAFITWIGPSVTPLKKAAVSTDKAFLKAICNVCFEIDNINDYVFVNNIPRKGLVNFHIQLSQLLH